MEDSYILVIGAVNIDISGTSKEQLVLYDSNPGVSHISFGGVGRNIADNLCRLGERVEMLTVLGEDLYARELIDASERIGISFKHSLTVKNGHTSTYIFINDSDGEMSLAVSDMEIYKHLTVDYIKSKLDVLENAKLVIMDTNIPRDTINYVAGHCTAPIIVDPVSTKKAEKLVNVLDRLYAVKPNIYEAEILAGIKIEGPDDIARAAAVLIEKGVKSVFISMSENGVYYSDGTNCGTCPCAKGRVINTTGCGDAFVAAASWSLLNGKNVHDMAIAGVAAAAVCAESEDTISEYMSAENVISRINRGEA